MIYKRENSGALLKNTRKETDKHPDYTGSATIAGVEYWISAWVNESKDGKKYFAMNFNPKDAKGEAAQPKPQTPKDDDLPF